MLRLALIVAGAVLVSDQVTKWLILAKVMDPPRIIEVTGFFNLVLVWNRGISFGLLGNSAGWQSWVLAAFGAVVAGGLLVWLHRAVQGLLPSLGIGLIVGGALGNVIDRLRFGAVVDFLDFHVGGWHWPAFNVADSAITIGVAMLVLDAILHDRAEKA
ncbi:signal peptidase II [Ferruginivarius sediminum]|uniref:Lipoprotein signal peptidase n=1 Tax=Ferruginivarius sediminum TaxID=2661937 RepID=A0A369T5H6_9PROT|nr:signal peptidase II [Ferruginivarius sediminum]RDD60508.1 signal peptidase II [Ferruginivarius sediminum]